MSLFESLTSEDLPLSYRFPRWNSTLYYPCASIVIFDVDSDSDVVEYHIFVAEKDVNPEQDNPRLSVINKDGNWRDLTGRAIDSITSSDVDSDSETIVTLIINYDDNTDSGPLTFSIPISQASGGADTESVAISVESDGTVSFGSNFADDNTARSSIRDLIRVGFDQLSFSPAIRNSEAGFVADSYIDSDGRSQAIRATFLDATTSGFTSADFLFIQTDDVTPIPPRDFDLPLYPSFFVNPVFSRTPGDVGGVISTLDWDQPLVGFRYMFMNPTDRDSESFISAHSITTNNPLTTHVPLLGSFTDEVDTGNPRDGNSTRTFFTDLDNDLDASIFPIIPMDPAVEQSRAGSGVVNLLLDALFTPGGTDVPQTLAALPLTVNWNYPELTDIEINVAALRGQQSFLNAYNSTNFTISHTGVGEIDNTAAHALTGTGVNITLNADNETGNVTFTDPIHKDNINLPRNIRSVTDFVRPATVIGREVTINDIESDTVPVTGVNIPSFTFPTFWLMMPTDATNSPRNSHTTFITTEADILRANSVSNLSEFITTADIYNGNVNVLGNRATSGTIIGSDTTLGTSRGGPRARAILIMGYHNSVVNPPNTLTQETRVSGVQPTSFSTSAITRLTPDLPLGSASQAELGSGFALENYVIHTANIGTGILINSLTFSYVDPNP